jgi:hypothetical protein
VPGGDPGDVMFGGAPTEQHDEGNASHGDDRSPRYGW